MYDFSNAKLISFNSTGNGLEYFKIFIVNWILTILTLGLYYPWAKEKQLKYLYSTINIDDDPFCFHGIGKEMFKGLMKTILLIIVLYGITMLMLLVFKIPILATLSIYVGLALIYPLAIHGSIRYRTSRSSWRGIRLSYLGNKKELILNYLKWIFFTVVTVGIYSSWFTINLRNYLLSNVRLGDIKLTYNGSGSEYFIINLQGVMLTILTLGIYSFWWKQEQFNYFVNNLRLEKDDNLIMFHSIATPGKIFELLFVNFFMTVFSLGLAYPWVMIRNINFVIDNVTITGNLDLNNITQISDEYSDATGDYLSDFFDINIF